MDNEERIIKVDYEDEMKQAFIDYSMSVIVGRAIPDVRDGLKPVHRRILYAMLDLGLDNSKSYRKSARIVGDTMGKFHPHGDSSIYDAMVKMAQDFNLNLPLVDGQGNFGSIDGDSAAAMRYCVTEDTIVNTNRGLVRIADLVKNSELNSENDLDCEIESFQGMKNHASKFFNSGVHDILSVQTQMGYQINGTKNHPILTLSKNEQGLPQFKWKLLEEINIGDYIVINRRKNQIESTTDYISEIEAQLLGAMVSEGNIRIAPHSKNSHSYYRVGFTNTNSQFINDVEKAFKQLFPELKITKNEHNGFSEVYLHNKGILQEFIDKYNYSIESKTKVVPDCVLKSSLKMQRIFLRYLFEGDGCPVRYKKGNVAVSYSSSSIKLVKQIQIMLLQFGVVSSLKKDKDNFRLIIGGVFNVECFKNEIDFAYNEKREKLSNILDEADMSKDRSITDYIPFISEYARNKYKDCWLKRHNFDRRNNFKRHKSRLEKILSSEDMDLIQKMFELKYIYLKVENVCKADNQVVYSIKVDSDCHSFSANGFINHNTEARLAPPASELLQDLEKQVVDFIPTYDDKQLEPTVLPARLPNLLINGTDGIAVGMRTSMPPHNPEEVIKAIIHYIDNPNATTKQLMNYIQGPDFPTGGIIINKKDLLNIYETGNGSIRVRGKLKTEDAGYGRTNIIITEIPYSLSNNKTGLIEQIATLARDKKLDEITDLRDESNKDEGIKIVIEVKKGVNVQNFINKLYKKTKLEDTIPLNFLVIVDSQPKVLSLKSLVEHYVSFQKEINTRKYAYLLKKANEREEVLQGLIKAHDIIDLIIEVIRGSKDVATAKRCLTLGITEGINFKSKKTEKDAAKFDFTERQTEAILTMQLQRLTNLELQKLDNELELIAKNIEAYKKIIENDGEMNKLIKGYLNDMKKAYKADRKTEIIDTDVVQYVEEFHEEDVVVIVDRFGYVKTTDPLNYNRAGEETVKEFKHILNTKNTDKLCVFTDKGNLYQLKLTDVPKVKIKEKGVPLDSLAKLSDEEIIYIGIWSEIKEAKLLFATRNGLVKITPGQEFESARTQISATKLDDNDTVVQIALLTEVIEHVVLISKENYVLKFKYEGSIPELKRNSKGVKAMILTQEDGVETMYLLHKGDSTVVEINHKETNLQQVRTRKRNQMGIKL